MNRYIDCDESLVEVFLEVMEKKFPVYGNLKIKLLFDTKKRINKGKTVLATVEMANDKIKYFSKDKVAIEGYDYILIVDLKAWQVASEKDKRRLISHELRHIFIDEKGNPKILGHEIEDFYIEIESNKDDPEWGRNLVEIITALYDQEKEMAKTKKKGKK